MSNNKVIKFLTENVDGQGLGLDKSPKCNVSLTVKTGGKVGSLEVPTKRIISRIIR